MLPLASYRILGLTGLPAGLIASLGLSLQPEAGYSVNALLSECLTEFLATAGFCASVGAFSQIPRTYILPGFLLGLATLARPGMVCITGLYGLALLCTHRRSGSVFLITTGVTIGIWSGYATLMSGRPILLSGNSSAVVVGGIDPLRASTAAGIPAPEISEESLRTFWIQWPGANDGSAFDYLSTANTNRSQFLKVQWLKLKIAFRSFPEGRIGLVGLGAVLGCLLTVIHVSQDHSTRSTTSGFLYHDHVRWLLWISIAFTIGVLAVDLGILQIISAIWIGICLSISIWAARNRDLRDQPLGCELAVFVCGYLLSVLISIGNPRFVRPTLPVFHLALCLALPLLLICATRSVVTGNGKQLKPNGPT